jgi:hypothetical protein
MVHAEFRGFHAEFRGFWLQKNLRDSAYLSAKICEKFFCVICQKLLRESARKNIKNGNNSSLRPPQSINKKNDVIFAD